MIKSIRAEKIYDLVQTIPAITNLVTVFSMKPDDNATPIWNYLFITIVSDNTMTSSNNWYIMKKARVSFHIVTKKTMANTDTPERILWSIIDALNNALVNQWCTKISNFWWYLIQSILEDTVSPIFLEDNRYYQIKDYIFNYLCI
jgi:hypothetical protein